MSYPTSQLGLYSTFYPRELAKLRGYTSCFVVAVVVVACLLVLYGSHARMQFGILPLQQGNSYRMHAVWYPATAENLYAV
jgi:hypothetical protein